ncbi:serine/threonine protein kinase US3 [Canid alphaherpesvirus 1]|uniref:US3 n=1 Tax=Canid alphaherpesvirus 1 TaxID=170325 RepID=O41522_9ALPH|nr:serine/threonine protein kinase US3 [Canid alphaherpesvirus 1]AAB67056.1 cUS3 [Canid alphaherpesvirus 1]AAB93491.1 US3 [Canid alphaherpesvirus 1]AAK51060.1 protein kinase US3 [Canid alphaherpesvirus 1]ALL25942.1 serine/threonine protein kinase US3 [Canid alphaherpesvirus 1]ALL26022.1 serine/threonine protein kinase US3 [Canid alphaherpesvirus 1]
MAKCTTEKFCCISVNRESSVDPEDFYKPVPLTSDLIEEDNLHQDKIMDEDLYSDFSDDDFMDYTKNPTESENERESDEEVEESYESDEDKKSLSPTKSEGIEAAEALKFSVVKSLTPGSEGRVFIALKKDKDTSYKVILKIGQRGNTLVESLILRNISHQSIIKLQDTLFYKELTCLVLPYYKYDLYNFLMDHGKSLSFESVIKIEKQILTGLQYIHGKKIIHRDIKTENIFLDNDSNVCIGDFGASQFPVSSPDYLGIAGTIETNAPEVLSKDAYNCKADIWSAGIILFEMLAYPNVLFEEEERDSSDLINNCNLHLIKIISTLKINPNEFPSDLESNLVKHFIKYANNDRPPFTRYNRLNNLKLHLDGEFLIHKMLTFDASLRPSAEELLSYQIFSKQ